MAVVHLRADRGVGIRQLQPARWVLGLGDAAQLAAWLAIDSQDYGAARQYCALALPSAEEGEDPNLHSYVLGVMSYIHLHAGRRLEALRLLEAALHVADSHRFGVDPAVRSWLCEAMGEVYAIAGERQAGARALAQAEQLFDAVCSGTVPHIITESSRNRHRIRKLLPAFAPYAHLETVQALTYSVC